MGGRGGSVFRILPAWGIKLWRNLVVLVPVLLDLFPDGRRENSLCEGWEGSLMMMMVAAL